MKNLLAYLILTGLLVTGVTTQVMADDEESRLSPEAKTAIEQQTTVQLKTDADYNLDYSKTNSKDCEVNKQIGLTPEQRIKLRGSRLKLQQDLAAEGLIPSQDVNIDGHKAQAVQQILTPYQYRQYLLLREQCS